MTEEAMASDVDGDLEFSDFYSNSPSRSRSNSGSDSDSDFNSDSDVDDSVPLLPLRLCCVC